MTSRSLGPVSVRRAPHPADPGVPGWLVTLLAVACGATVANIYYAQPLLPSLRGVFHISTAAAGGLVTATQIGYVLGVVFLVPLGDRVEKRRLVAILLTITAGAMVAAGVSVSFPMLLIAALISGITSTVAQILVPFAAGLAPEHARGRIVGRVMSGLLVGILLSRTLSSIISGLAGWRVVYLGSAVLMAVLAFSLRSVLPNSAPTTEISYVEILRFTFRLMRTYPQLRRRGFYQTAMFGAFSAFWTTISFLLTGPGYRYSPLGVGLFALVGAGGAAVAPLAGRWADRELARPFTGAAFATAAAALAIAGFGQHHVVLLAVGAVMLDVAVQTNLILGQHTVYRLDPAARARLNSAFIAIFFTGGAIGSQLGSVAYRIGGWSAVAGVGTVLALLGLLYWITEPRRDVSRSLGA